jgi:serine/threonine protein kinase/tetratricopeptide (TPR) repeat protein
VTPWPNAGPVSLQTKRARGLLESALARKPSERVAFIDGACGDDDRLREETLALLDASETSGDAPRLQLPSDRAGAIVANALQRRRNERSAFVEGACAGDEALRGRVVSLLESVESGEVVATVETLPTETSRKVNHALPATTLADEPTRIAPADSPTRTPPTATIKPEAPSCTWHPGMTLEGRRLGPYQLLHQIGKGGMGSVYLATRADQEYKKTVAIKLVTSELSTEEMLRRFRNERQVLASLDHPCIARLLDGGSTDDGLPYLVMEYVDGLPIDKYCESHEISLTDRLKLFQKVCSGVQFAHQNLVVHRDIKPGNILVGADGEPKLLDFGIAKLMTAESNAEDIELNKGEAQPMTLRYASPEQVKGGTITTESDIYSLGVLLFELVAREHPFQDALTGRAAIQEATVKQEPPKPSAVLRRKAGKETGKEQRRAITKLAREVDGDIDSIALMPLAKQPRDRYSSAEAFAWDITRYLNGFPVYGRRDDMGYRVAKFVRRHALSVISAALLVVALIVSTIVSLQFLQSARGARAVAQSRFEDVRKLANFVLFDFDKAIRSGPTAARKVLVTEALAYLDRLAKDTNGDPSLDRDLVDGYLKVGDLQGNPYFPNVGDSAGANNSYAKAMRVAEALRVHHPTDPRARDAVARVNMKLGDMTEFSGKHGDAIRRYKEAQDVLAALAPSDVQAKHNLIVVTDRIGTSQRRSGDITGALASYQRQLQYSEELLAANPNDEDIRRQLPLSYEKVGGALANTGAISEGLEKLRKARSIYEATAAMSPQSPARADLSTLDIKIGATLAGAGRNDEAIESYRSAIRTLETLAAEDPNNTEYKRNLHVTLGRLADALYARGKKPESRQATERALKVLRPMVDAANASDYDVYAYCWILLTTPFSDLHAPILARTYAERLAKSSQEKDPNTLDLLARAYDASGDSARAVLTETKALGLLPAGSASELRTELTANLEKFRARAKSK